MNILWNARASTNRRSELLFGTSSEIEIEKVADIICELSGKGIVS